MVKLGIGSLLCAALFLCTFAPHHGTTTPFLLGDVVTMPSLDAAIDIEKVTLKWLLLEYFADSSAYDKELLWELVEEKNELLAGRKDLSYKNHEFDKFWLPFLRNAVKPDTSFMRLSFATKVLQLVYSPLTIDSLLKHQTAERYMQFEYDRFRFIYSICKAFNPGEFTDFSSIMFTDDYTAFHFMHYNVAPNFMKGWSNEVFASAKQSKLGESHYSSTYSDLKDFPFRNRQRIFIGRLADAARIHRYESLINPSFIYVLCDSKEGYVDFCYINGFGIPSQYAEQVIRELASVMLYQHGYEVYSIENTTASDNDVSWFAGLYDMADAIYKFRVMYQ